MTTARHRRVRRLVLAAATAAAVAAAVPTSAGAVDGWQSVGSGIKVGISGLAGPAADADGTVRTLAVRDNKRPGDNRLAAIDYRPDASAPPHVEPLAWQDSSQPIDLEAITAVPGAPGEYVALASRGLVYRIQVDGGAAHVLGTTPLPAINDGADFESFELVSRGGRSAAVWADRGDGAGRPATVFAAPFSVDAYGEMKFGPVRRAAYRAPYPDGDIRHASDIAVTDSGRLLISAAADAGDDGPFDSAVHEAGRVTVRADGGVGLTIAKSPEVLEKFAGYKVEAVDCVPGGTSALLGTDDENAGGSVTSTELCR